MKEGQLFIVATPIGNMGDITARAIEIISAVDFVVCEDTRVTGGLLHQLNIKKELIALHQHSSDEKIGHVIKLLESGKSVAYVSDNGTPGVSDPGQKLVDSVRESGLEIIPIPGASALTSAISVSGMIEKEFYFAGFLPKKKGRETKLKELMALSVPIVIYESAPRIERTLKDIEKFFGLDSEIFIAREMTKKFEEYWGGNVDKIIANLANHQIKGEFVLVVKKTTA